MVARGGGGGSRRYTEHLAAGLVAAGRDVTVIAGSGEFGAPRRPLLGGTAAINGLWAFARWPKVTSVVRGHDGIPDLVHAAEKVVVPPVPRGVALAVTVHDTWCLARPDACRGRLGFLVRRAWRTRSRWNLVLTGTHSTLAELAELGFPAERVAVTPYGIGEAFRPGAPRDDGSLRGAVLFVGEPSRKKGFDLLARAVARLRDRGDRDVVLLLRGPRTESIPQDVPGRLGSSLRHMGQPLTDEELAELYRSVGAVVCPSRAEGYNFPLVEALASGATVVASDIPVHREVSKGAALLVEPGSPEALADGIERALGGERPIASSSFEPPRWEDTVRDTLEAYGGVVLS